MIINRTQVLPGSFVIKEKGFKRGPGKKTV